ncbi:hypothetical protein Tsubulata_021023 [Turnera subulata]|uniref:F-box domain-containing protein n=1 Tax=Turnera subulata TaxID=218843 RepID=A0A9Q0FYS4_9ROSI|nr:hypothetical protein Tsubulata_021023 [Turnera subulata]
MDKGGEITMSAGGGIPIFPWDAVADILCCLPMKSVLRFKAVSKAWCSLIESSYFARLQLSASNHDPMLVILTNPYIQRTGWVLCADFYSLDDDIAEVDDGGAASSSSSLRQHVSHHVPLAAICEFQSYNLEANGFTTFHTLPGDHALDNTYYSEGTPSCFVNGALHWLAAVSSDGFFSEIVALQLETLECYKLPLVRYRRYRYCKPTLVVLDGLLCATFSNCRDGFTRYKIDAWVMKEYGGKWTKLFNLTTSCLPDGFLDRTVDVGRVTGWGPRVEVLGHPSIGGFKSHCGWNSVLEAIWHEVEIGAWPLYAEQQFNAFELVLGLAVEIRLDYRSSDQHHMADIVDAGGDIERSSDRSEEERMKLLDE